MHSFGKLIEGAVGFTFAKLNDLQDELYARLKEDTSTVYIRNLQSISLQRAVTSVGMFSIFEAELQRQFGAENGFRTLKEKLICLNEPELIERFDLYYWAVNALKHGRGSSYDKLLERKDNLPFQIKGPDESFFDEGDVSEIDTLILVNDDFVTDCARLIHDLSIVIERQNLV